MTRLRISSVLCGRGAGGKRLLRQRGGSASPAPSYPSSIGALEDSLNLVAWVGYVEDGSERSKTTTGCIRSRPRSAASARSTSRRPARATR